MFLAANLLFSGCFSSDEKETGTIPVLNNLSIIDTDYESITIDLPSFSTEGSPIPEVNAYIGTVNNIQITGAEVTNFIEGPVDVSFNAYQFTGLDPDTAYKILVVAFNSEGYSVKEIIQSTSGIAPVLNDLALGSVTATSIALEQPTFATAGNPEPDMQAYIGIDGTISISGSIVTNFIEGPVDVSEAGYEFDSLNVNSTYRIVVVAHNSEGHSVKQVVQSTSGIAPVLNNLSIESFDETSITVSQPTLSIAGNPTPSIVAYIGYNGNISIDGTVVSDSIAGPVDVSTGSHQFTGLDVYNGYKIIVVAENDEGSSVKEIYQDTSGIVPVLNDLAIENFDSSSITLERPTFSVAGNPVPTVYAYLGREGTIAVTGNTVSNSLEGPINVSSGGYQFSGLDDNSSYKIIVVSENDEGSDVKSILCQTSPLPLPEINVKQGSVLLESGAGIYDFDEILVNSTSPEVIFTIGNSGTADLSLTDNTEIVRLNGANTDDFTVDYSMTSTTISPGSSTSFKVIFSPVSHGNKSAVITIANNDKDINPYSFTITGNALPKTSWVQVTDSANWSARYGHGAVVFDNKMWIMGGANYNDVWNSEDGVNWTQVTASAAWTGRSSISCVVFEGKMWVLGCGYNDGNDDVWCSEDGVTWTQTASSIGWNYITDSFVYDSKIWAFGQSGAWSSEDGINWSQVCTYITSAWKAEIFNDKIFSFEKGRVSTSIDGVTYDGLTGLWNNNLSYYSTIVYNNSLWIIGGDKRFNEYTNEVWTSLDGEIWNLTTPAGPWAARKLHAVLNYDGKIWILGGRKDVNLNDVWCTEPVNSVQGVSATKKTYTDKIRITWSSFPGGEKYFVYRAKASDGTYSLLTVDGVTGLSYEDTTPDLGTDYLYKISAFSEGAGESNLSLPALGYRYGLPSPTLYRVWASDGTYPGKIRIQCSAVQGADSYSFYQKKSDGTWETNPYVTTSLDYCDYIHGSSGELIWFRAQASSNKYGQTLDYSEADSGYKQ